MVRAAALRGVIALFVIPPIAAGCALVRDVQPVVDDLSSWSRVPLPADAALADRARGEASACAHADQGPIRILLQDRRTQWTAAFLFDTATTFGSCFVTSAQGGSGGGSGPLPEPLTSRISVDDNGAGNVASASAHEVGGRIAADVAGVVVELENGETVVASIGGGYWLAWWPGSFRPDHVIAMDASGAELEQLDIPRSP